MLRPTKHWRVNLVVTNVSKNPVPVGCAVNRWEGTTNCLPSAISPSPARSPNTCEKFQVRSLSLAIVAAARPRSASAITSPRRGAVTLRCTQNRIAWNPNRVGCGAAWQQTVPEASGGELSCPRSHQKTLAHGSGSVITSGGRLKCWRGDRTAVEPNRPPFFVFCSPPISF